MKEPIPDASGSYGDYGLANEQALFIRFRTSRIGLSESEVNARLGQFGYNELAQRKRRTGLVHFFSKFIDPLVLVLLIIAVISFFFGEKISAFLVTAIAVISVILSFMQEYRAGVQAEKLSEMVRATATVFRNGKSHEVKLREIVPGDIVNLNAGDMIPADLRILECKDLFINQSALTGESFPMEKFAEPASNPSSSITELQNIAFMGSSVLSGAAVGLVLKTGSFTQFGELAKRITGARVDTSFDRGIKQFVWLMIRLMIIMVTCIFGINFVFKGNFIEALLFSLSVAVGLTPEMLPMLVAINFSKGAINMAKKQVIVKRLNFIQNFGAMDVLCTDKTGTLTQDRIVLEKYCDVIRKTNEEVLQFAYVNSFYQTGLKNLLDRAILEHEKLLLKQCKKIDEIPFDFSRKIMSVVVEMDGRHRLIAKGAPEEIFKRCTQFELNGGKYEMQYLLLADLKEEYEELSSGGFRVLAVAYKDLTEIKSSYSKIDEENLILKGYVAFLDPPKPSVQRAIRALKELGIEIKVLTGDNELVTKKICSEVSLDVQGLLIGDAVEKMTDAQLSEAVKSTNVFARLSPLQKERVIREIQRNGHTVGYLGDGINDAPALKASDIGISVKNAVDIAKESADMILLKKNLLVLKDGVVEGRKTFGNVIKYIKMSSSSNFGNMFSMTVASLLLPFLPMRPIQILLNNFLYDLSQVAIPTDNVDREFLLKPRPWKVKYIRKFMLTLGPISSLFDFITFAVLWFFFKGQGNQALFQTGWFIESVCTQTLVAHIIRTNRIPFVESRPSRSLLLTSMLIVVVAFVILLSPAGSLFGFVSLPPLYFVFLFIILIMYLTTVQIVKSWFLRRSGDG